MELELLKEIAGYFRKSDVDGLYYLRDGYMNLPQELIDRLMTVTGMKDYAVPCHYGIVRKGCNGVRGPWCGYCRATFG